MSDHAPQQYRSILQHRILRSLGGSTGSGDSSPAPPPRRYPPTSLEWKSAQRRSGASLPMLLPDGSSTAVAVDPWTTCEEAAALAVSAYGIDQDSGWTVTLDDSGIVTGLFPFILCPLNVTYFEYAITLYFIFHSESCGLDYVLDLVGEIELCPAFPALRNDALRFGKRGGSRPVSPPRVPETPDLPSPSELSESSSPRRPQVIYEDFNIVLKLFQKKL